MNINICDRCRKKMPGKNSHFYVEEDAVDLCRECYKDFTEWLKRGKKGLIPTYFDKLKRGRK